MANKQLVEKRERIKALQGKIQKFLDQAKNENGQFDLSGVKVVEGTNKVKQEKLDSWNKELNDCYTKALELRSIEQAEEDSKRINTNLTRVDRGGFVMPRTAQQFNLGKAVTGGDAYKTLLRDRPNELSLYNVEGDGGSIKGMLTRSMQQQKALFTSAAGWVPYPTETPDVVPAVQRPVQLLPFIRQIPTDQHAVIYSEQTTRTISAAERAEGGVYPESTLAYTRRTQDVETIGHFIPVTREELADVPMAESMINQDLMAGLMQRIDLQVIAGTGASNQLLGVNSKTGIQTLTKLAAFTVLQGIVRSIGMVASTATGGGQAMASVIAMSTIRWYSLMETQTTDGWYLFGLGASEPRLFGVPVAMHDGIPDTTGTKEQAIIGDFARHSYLRDRQAASVRIETRHRVSSNMTRPTGQLSLVADARAAFVIRRAAAFVAFQVEV